jgi:glycosyltransferase involved in cell wall biosynthesis
VIENAVQATVLIPTYNRATLLDETLTWLAATRVPADFRWEVVVIDNNSADDTRAVVERHALTFPVPLCYLFETQQGRSNALNAGIAAARGTVLAFTDDDVRVAEGWLAAAAGPLLEDFEVAYTGGPVRPIWEVPPPAWLDLTRGDLWGTIAIQDHGEAAVGYEDAGKVPLGANMAVRRDVFAVVGGFRADLGRSGSRVVMGQEVPEWLIRARRSGFRGRYVPAMEVQHHIPAARLTRRYFRRWWFGKGISRAALEQMQPVTDSGIDLRRTPHMLGVPRFMYGTLARDVWGWLQETVRRRPAAAFRHAMGLAYFAGYCSARWRARRSAADVYRTSNVVSTGR